MPDPNELRLSTGDTLQLEFADTARSGRYLVTLIGYLANRSLIVTAPKLNNKPLLVREGQVFSARMLAGNTAQGFVTSVLASRSHPFPYMHLKPPAEVAVATVRQSHRVRVTLTMVVQVLGADGKPTSGDPIPGRILDLSTDGALISAMAPLGDIGTKLQISTRLSFERTARSISVEVTIRNCPENCKQIADAKTPHCYGISFGELRDFDQLMLRCFVNQKLVEQLMT